MAETEKIVIHFVRYTRTLSIMVGKNTSEVDIASIVCDHCGSVVDENDENKQKHADWHGEVENIKRGLATHRQYGDHNFFGPLT